MTGKILGAVLTIVIGLAMLPIINGFVDDLVFPGSADPVIEAGPLYGTTAGSLVSLLPILYVLILVAGTIGYVAFSRKQ